VALSSAPSRRRRCWGFLRFIRQYVEEIPIPAVPPVEQKALEGLVGRILKAKKGNGAADVRALEREIDQRVCALSGLTPDEIKIVEDSTR